MVLALPLIAFPLIARSRSILNRLFGIAIVIFLLGGIWLSQSRAAMLAIVIGFAGHFLTRGKFRIKYIVPLSLILIFPIIFFTTINRDESDISGSNSMRLEYMMAGFRMMKSNPITGVGFDNYSDLFERYTTKFDEYGKRTAHSSWVLAMAETGLPGLILFVSLFLFVLRRSYHQRFIQPEQFVAMISYGICMSLLSHTYQLAPYVLFAWILSSKKLLTPTTFDSIGVELKTFHVEKKLFIEKL